MKALWKGQIVAESDDTVVVEGNHYFPSDSINKIFFEDSSKTTFCGWKGSAHYYSITVNGETNQDSAFFYPEPKSAAEQIKDRVAFWRGVEVIV
ncbi:MAG: hypothetical protein ACJAYG_002411 [Oceanicoccus sp.]|jgi:uncharacterized protein (DUF427 family)